MQLFLRWLPSEISADVPIGWLPNGSHAIFLKINYWLNYVQYFFKIITEGIQGIIFGDQLLSYFHALFRR